MCAHYTGIFTSSKRLRAFVNTIDTFYKQIALVSENEYLYT